MHLPSRPTPDSPLSRETLITLLQAALSISENRFARLAALGWLGAYPGDLQVRLLYARAMIQESLLQQAIPVLDDLVTVDPDYMEAQEALASTRYLLGGPKSLPSVEIESASAALAQLRDVIADKSIHPKELICLAQAYHQRWTDCVPIKLLLADLLMQQGEHNLALELLHQAVTQDVTGQVAVRMWGSSHPYHSLWPDKLSLEPGNPSAPQSLPIPASITALFGWNQLSQGINPPFKQSEYTSSIPSSPSIPSTKSVAAGACASRRKYTPSDELKKAQPEFEAIAQQIKKPGLSNLDGRFPVYVILSSRSGLERQYGTKNFSQIDLELRGLLEAIVQSAHWGALVYYVDDPELSPARASFNLKPAVPTDPWEVKLAIADLDAALGEQGEMIGAVLIVGGPQIIPFHQLPNPVDDEDTIVFSDNPYCTRDENYFIPEWPVGRIPGDSTIDPACLHKTLRQIIAHHRQNKHSPPWFKKIWLQVNRTMRRLLRQSQETANSLGYSAAIWRRASLSVYRTIGEPRALLVSPPVQIQSSCPVPDNGSITTCRAFPSSKLGYFNLHGLADAEEWFGQRDPTEPMPGPDYPIALRPQDIGSNGTGGKNHAAPEVVFSEACYGAHIQQKTVDQSISLKFLASGTKAFVGSTCISYGSISTPLIAADLLGRAFWNYVREGFPTGEALRRAKMYLAREMHNRQGYLDGEDQKTLISFVLFGDPLAQAAHSGKRVKSILRQVNSPHIPQTICDRTSSPALSQAVPQEMTKQVKQIVAEYLPGMQNASIRLSRERAGCQGENHICPSAQLGTKTLPGASPNRQVVVLSKTVRQVAHTHPQYARLTLDASGKLVKLVVSR